MGAPPINGEPWQLWQLVANAFDTAQGKDPPEVSVAATPPEPAVPLVEDVDDVDDGVGGALDVSPVEPLPADGITVDEELPAALGAAVDCDPEPLLTLESRELAAGVEPQP